MALSSGFLFLPAVFVIGCAKLGVSAEPVVFSVTPDNVFSRGHNFYRLLYLDEDSNSLYVGAMNHLYRLWMFNINDTENRQAFAEKELKPTPDALARCAYRSTNPDFHCQNHIRVVFKISDGLVYICSTNAFSPSVTKLDVGTLAVLEKGLSGAAICPVDPDDNGTAVWVENGNPENVPSIYSATVTDFTQNNRIIYRPPLLSSTGAELKPFLRTMHTDSKWLNEPNFVGSFDIDEYVYFFFRESAVEFINCGKAVYSRVARVCKCVPNTQDTSDSVLHFAKSHLLMDEAVSSSSERPLFLKRDLLLNHLVVDQLSPHDQGSLRVVFAASQSGAVYKIVEWLDSNGAQQANLVAVYQLPHRAAVFAMQLLPTDFIYVAQDAVVSQLSTAQCSLYSSCAACTADPYCSWDTRQLQRVQCHRAHDKHHFAAGWILAAATERGSPRCLSRPTRHSRLLYPGDSAHLDCAPTAAAAAVHEWTRDNTTLPQRAPLNDRNSLLRTVDGGLVLVNITKEDSGIYDCYVQRQLIVSYQIFVDDVNCQRPHNLQAFQSAYRQWCREFQQYKTTMIEWQKWYDQNTQCQNGPFKKLATAGLAAEPAKSNRINR